jgi:putative heme utilization carrier protein HutX
MDQASVLSGLRARLEADPGAIAETLAAECNVTLRQVIEALPETMRRLAPGECFVAVMEELATWGDVTVILHSDDGVMEFTGPTPKGSIGRGYYNLAGSKGFHGHLRHDRCAGVAFVERPVFGRHSASIVFFNPAGSAMFKVFVGRDEKRELLQDQLAAFRALAKRFANHPAHSDGATN